MTKRTTKNQSQQQDFQSGTASASMKFLNQINLAVKWFLHKDNLANWFEQTARQLATVLVYIYVAGVVVGERVYPIALTAAQILKDQAAEIKRRADAVIDTQIELAVNNPKK